MVGNYRIDVNYSNPLAPGGIDLRKLANVEPNGRRPISGAPTLENRGYDVTGPNVIFSYNYWLVFRHRTAGVYWSTDGEGMLHQEVGGGTPVDGWVVENNYGNAYIGIYKSRDIKNTIIRGNTIIANPYTNDPAGIYVNSDTNTRNFQMENVLIENNYSEEGMHLQTSKGAYNVIVRNNNLAGTTLRIPDKGVTLSNNTNIGSTILIPTDDINLLPTVEITSPADGFKAAPGAQITLLLSSFDDGGNPVSVEIWNDLIMIGNAVNTGTTGSFSFDLTLPTEPGYHYYFARANGTPDAWWTPTFVIEVSNDVAVLIVPQISLSSNAGQMQIQFSTQAGFNYRIQSSPDLGNWTDLESVAGNGSTVNRNYPQPAEKVFYRVAID